MMSQKHKITDDWEIVAKTVKIYFFKVELKSVVQKIFFHLKIMETFSCRPDVKLSRQEKLHCERAESNKR